MKLAPSADAPGTDQIDRTPNGEAFRILTALRRIIRATELHSRRLSAMSNLTAPQLVCLLEIARRGGTSSRAIGQSVHLAASTLVGIVDRLEAKGLVERRRSVQDRRIVELHATEKGLATLGEAPSPLQEVLLRNLQSMSPSRRGEVAATLEVIVGLMEVESVEAEPFIEAGSNIDLQQEASALKPGVETLGDYPGERIGRNPD